MVELTSESTAGKGDYSLDATFSCLANGDRRRLLRYLLASTPGPVPREELATALVTRRRERSRQGVTDDERQDAALALHHRHLPALAEASLVEYDADDGSITLADHPALQDQGIVEAIEDGPERSESLDALFGALADAGRRTILDVLSHQIGAIHVETLARELVTDGQDAAESEVPEAALERTLTRLHHVDLPHLSEADLIGHDAEAGTVEYTGHPVLRVPWMHSVLEPEFRPSLTGESEPSGIGEVDGRERVISFGQSLCDRADEELFCMFTDTQLLEAGCLTRIRDAVQERDVDVYLGTRDPNVREYVRENAPEVVLWEPNTDWLNLPVAGDRVGRLLLADREAVMLGTLLERTSDGFHEEQAMIGEGDHNTLVTLIRQLLTPHLEEIDKDTDDIEARLPV